MVSLSEGIVEKLTPFTTGLGIALVHSQGFYAEFAEMLAEGLIKYRGRIGILTDFDATGINIGLRIRGPTERLRIPTLDMEGKVLGTEEMDVELYRNLPRRLGIDAETLQGLDLSVEGLAESALDKKGQPNSYWVGLQNTLQGKKKRDKDKEWTYEQREFYFSYLTEKHKKLGEGPDGNGISYIDFLKEKRIELDIVVNAVGPQRFWDRLRDKILKTFKTWDYNRAIFVPEYIPSPTVEEFQKRVEGVIKSVVSDRRKETVAELRDVKVLLDINKRLEEIKADLLNNYILKDPQVMRIDKHLQKLIGQLPPAP